MKKILFTAVMAIGFVITASTQTYIVTTAANPTTGGTTSGDGIYQENDILSSVQAIPNSGYSLMYWTVNGSSQILYHNNLIQTALWMIAGNYNITDGNVHLTAHFTNVHHTINATPFPPGAGTITGGGTYFEGETATLTATANAGYGFTSSWIDPNGSIQSTNNPYNIYMIADKEVIGLFGKTGEAVVYTGTLGGGTTSGSGTYPLNSPITITATPSNGYAFVKWEQVGSPSLFSTNSTHTFTPTAQTLLNLRAVFSNTQYNITTSATPSAGGTTSGGGMYLFGTQVTVVATANAGYHFVRWTGNGGAEVSTDNNYTFTVGEQHLALTAEFEANPAGTYTVATSANPTIGGTTTGNGAFAAGASVTLTATPNANYQFEKWTENGNEISTANPYTFTASGTDRTLVAQFEPITASINDIAANTIAAMYPNPANTVLYIEVKDISAPLNIQIVDVLGAAIAAQQLNTGNNTVDVSNLTNGVYLIHYSNGGIVKFIKQ